MQNFNSYTPYSGGKYPFYHRGQSYKSNLDNGDMKRMALRSIGIKSELLHIFLDGMHAEYELFNIFDIDEYIKAYKQDLQCTSTMQTVELRKHFGRADWAGFKEDFFNKPLGAWSDDDYVYIASCSAGRVVLVFADGAKKEWFEATNK